MAISTRQVKNKRDSNGVLTGRPGTVYDVNIKYTAPNGEKKTYSKKGFPTKKEATQHEAEIRVAVTVEIARGELLGRLAFDDDFAAPHYLLLLLLIPFFFLGMGLWLWNRRRRLRRFGDEALVNELMPSWSRNKLWVRTGSF